MAETPEHPAAPLPGGAAPEPAATPGMALHTKILLGLLLGGAAGLIAHELSAAGVLDPALVEGACEVARPIGQVFLRLIFMVVIPLICSSLVLGILELGDVTKLGRVGLRTLGYTVVASSVSVVIGIGLVNLLRPGEGIDPAAREVLLADLGSKAQSTLTSAKQAKGWADSLLALIPTNPAAAAVQALTGEMLALMVFALIFGLALGRVRGPRAEGLIDAIHTIQQASMRIVDWAMALAPYGVAALLFQLSAKTGLAAAGSLGAYAGVVVLGLCLQMFGFYSLALGGLARVAPLEWFARCRVVILTAFSTSSSNATLPTTLETAGALGIPQRIGNFVLTIGASANQNGTALFEGVTVLFLAQFYGIELSLGAQVTVVLFSILAGVGTAGVPGGSLPLIAILLQSVGIPPEGIGIILGVDRVLDMCRTVVNVVGDLVCATVVTHLEGELSFAEAASAGGDAGGGQGPLGPA